MESVAVLAGVALLTLIVVWMQLRRRRLASAALATIEKQWAALQKIPDPARRILEADSILDHALTALGYRGTLGEKLKRAGPRFSNLNALWSAHKLRNRIAHEPGTHIESLQAQQALAALRRAIDDLR